MSPADKDAGRGSDPGQRDAGERDEETRCGFFECRPRWLQIFNNPNILCVLLCIFNFLQAFTIIGINNVNTTAYERRFHLSSTDVGWISSSCDIAAAVFGFPLGYLGCRKNKPRIICVGILISAVGTVCMFLPHFITDLYQSGDSISGPNICSTTELVEACGTGETDLRRYMALLIVGQVLLGIGGCSIMIVGFSLLDDSIPATSTPLYIGIVTMSYVLGPIIGFVLGGQFLSMYVDMDTVSADKVDLTPEDPRWVGAWWLGFVCSAVLTFLVALPFALFAYELPTAKKVRETRVSEAHTSESYVRTYDDRITLRQLPGLVLGLLHNPPFLCMSISFSLFSMAALSIATFLPKFIQSVFGATATSAATLAGLIGIPGAFFGQLFGGVMLRCLKWKVPGILRFILLLGFLSLVAESIFFLRCDKGNITGWDKPYHNESETKMVSSCNSQCYCDSTFYQPVCDATGTPYITPCLGGCANYTSESKTYGNCSCVPADLESRSLSLASCSTELCTELYIFLVLFFLGGFISSGSTVPTITVVLRCTHESERTLALATMNLLTRIIGTIPGPVMYGALIDKSCDIWGESCGTRTSCWLHDNFRFGGYMAALGYAIRALAVIFISLALCLYRAPPDEKYRTGTELDTVKKVPQSGSEGTHM